MSRYDRDADPVEFGRVVTLTDGVFAIALTLLVLDLALPAQAADAPLAMALDDMAPASSRSRSAWPWWARSSRHITRW